MRRQGRRKYQGKLRLTGVPTKAGNGNSRNGSAGFPRRGVLAGLDPETEDQIRRREVLAQALAGDDRALAELRALRIIRWERRGKVVIQKMALALNKE